MLAKPWILVATGVMINLNFIIKMVRVDTITPDYGIVFFHSSSGAGASQKVLFANATLADEKFAEIQAIMDAGAVFQDVS